MAGGFVKQRGASWYYICSYTDPDTGEYIREWVSPKKGGYPNTKRAAKRALHERLKSIEEGEKPGLARLTVNEWVSRWITGRVNAKPSSRRDMRDWLRYYIGPHIGHIPIGELTQTHVREWHGKLLSGAERRYSAPNGAPKVTTRKVGYWAVRKAHDLVSWSLAAAVEDRVLRVNVAANVPVPNPEPKPPRVIWDDAEQRRVLAAVADDAMWHAFIHLLLTSGLRVGEISALRWEDVDLARGRLMVQQGVSWDEERRPVFSTPKSPTSVRPVTLPASTVAALRRHHESLRFARRATGLVFRRENGDRLTQGVISRKLDSVAAQADVARLTPHGYRHLHGTMLMAEGVPLKVVQERLGHATPGYTAAMYQHVTSQLQDAAAQAIEDALNRTDDDTDDDARLQKL